MNGRLAFGVVAVGLAVGWMPVASLAQEPGGPAGDRPIAAKPGGIGRVEQIPPRTQLMDELEVKVRKLKAEHKALADELQAIVDLAVQEKAKKTAERTKRLLDAQRNDFEAELASLEKRLNTLKKSLSDAERRVKRENRIGNQAPLFDLKNPEGKAVQLSDYKGKVVVLEWANPDCPFWRYHAEKKTMVNLAARYKDKGVVWLAVNSTAGVTPDANKKTMDRYKLPYPILADASGQTARDYGVTNTPDMVVIDAKGTIAYSGAIDNAPMGKALSQAINYVDKALSELLEGRLVTTAQTKPYGSVVRFNGPKAR